MLSQSKRIGSGWGISTLLHVGKERAEEGVESSERLQGIHSEYLGNIGDRLYLMTEKYKDTE